MGFYSAFRLPDMAAVRAFISEKMLAAGFTEEYTSGSHAVYRVKNDLNKPTGTDAYFVVGFLLSGTTMGLTIARSVSGAGMSGAIPDSEAAKRTTFTAPYNVALVANSYRVALSVRDASNETAVFVAASLDYRELDTVSMATDSGHYDNMRNNNQCVFQVGLESSGRVLYAGEIGSNNVFNQSLVVDTMTRDGSSQYTPQGRMPVSTVLAGTTNNFQGLINGVYLVDSTAFHQYDRGVNNAMEYYRYFRNTLTDRGVLVKE